MKLSDFDAGTQKRFLSAWLDPEMSRPAMMQRFDLSAGDFNDLRLELGPREKAAPLKTWRRSDEVRDAARRGAPRRRSA